MTEIALNAVLALLLPLFLKEANGDTVLARQATLRLLECHGATTDRELLLAAEIIAFSFATLDNLGQSVANPDMALSTKLRLRSNANALSRSAERNRQTLARAKQAVCEPVLPEAKPPALPSAMQKVRDAIVEAAPSLAERLTSNAQTMSRQQRRFLMRKAEQARAAQEREARKTARLNARVQAGPAHAA